MNFWLWYSKQNSPGKSLSALIALLGIIAYGCASHGANVVHNAREVTPAPMPAKQPGAAYLHFLAVGDAGTGDQHQQSVADAMARLAQSSAAQGDTIAFALTQGDNFYENGVESVFDPLWKSAFEDIYDPKSLNMPFYPTLGNHDHRCDPYAQVEYTFSGLSTRWRMPFLYYTFRDTLADGVIVQFYALDTSPIAAASNDAAGQLAWLERELKNSPAQWKIAYGHHPMYSGGSHGDCEETRAALEDMFVTHDVALYLTGHDHDQQMLKPVRGVHHIISGAGGKSRDVEWQDRTLFAATNFGFTHFRVSRDNLVVEFYGVDNAAPQYRHVIPRD